MKGFRLDYVVDLTGDPKKDNPAFDGHYVVNGAAVLLGGITGASAAVFEASNDADGNTIVGDGSSVPITGVGIVHGGERIFINLASVTDPFSVSVGGQTYTIDQQPGGSVLVDGIVNDTAIVISTANGFDSLAITYELGDAFALTGVGSAVFDPGAQVNFDVPVDLVDADGDATRAALSLTLLPGGDLPPVADDETDITNENTPLNVAAPGVLDGDVDVDGDVLSVTQFTVAGDATIHPAGTAAVIAGVGSLTISADGSYSFVPAADFSGAVPIATYTVSDSTLTDEGTLTLTVNPVSNLPPGLDLDANNSNGGGSDYTSTFTIGGSAIPIADIDVTITDPDSTTIASARISMIANGQIPPNDTLSISGTLPDGITASANDPATGVLTLTGAASIADYQAALQQVVLSTADPFFNADRIISVTVNDGANTSNTAQTFMHVVGAPAGFTATDVNDLSQLLDANFEPTSALADSARFAQTGSNVPLQVGLNSAVGGGNLQNVAILTGADTPATSTCIAEPRCAAIRLQDRPAHADGAHVALRGLRRLVDGFVNEFLGTLIQWRFVSYMSAIGTKRTCRFALQMSAFWG